MEVAGNDGEVSYNLSPRLSISRLTCNGQRTQRIKRIERICNAYPVDGSKAAIRSDGACWLTEASGSATQSHNRTTNAFGINPRSFLYVCKSLGRDSVALFENDPPSWLECGT